MTDTMIPTAEMSLAELKAFVARLEAEAAQGTREAARPLLEHLMERHTVAPSTAENSTWVGFTDTIQEITHEGRTYSVKVVVTDVAAVAERKAEKKALDVQTREIAKAQAKAAALRAKVAELEGSIPADA